MKKPKLSLMNMIKMMPGINILTYKIGVEIYEERGNGFVVIRDRARRLWDQNIERFHLLKQDETIPAPKLGDQFMDNRGNNTLKLFKPQSGEYYPMSVNATGNPGAEFVPIDKDVHFWYAQEVRERSTMYAPKQDKWAKYFPYIMLGLMSTMMVVQILLFADGAGKITAGINSAASTFLRAVEAAGQSGAQLTTGVTVPGFG